MNWFYAESGQTIGPVNDEEFERRVASGSVRPETLVWHEGMAAWEPWARVRPDTHLSGNLSQEILGPPSDAPAPAAAAPGPSGGSA